VASLPPALNASWACLSDGFPSLGQARRIHELRSAIYLLFVLQQELEMYDT